MPDRHLRAADADRAAVAEVLGTHMAAGRLTLDEYDERLTRAYAARTFGELEELTADLPQHLPEPARDVAPATRADAGTATWSPHWGGHWGGEDWQAWAKTSAIVLSIWALTCLLNWQLIYFWPGWVIGPWGAILLVQTLTHRGQDDDEDDEQQRRLST
jgi:hypothetical protein